jgi:hypothetical protein
MYSCKKLLKILLSFFGHGFEDGFEYGFELLFATFISFWVCNLVVFVNLFFLFFCK